MDEKKGIKITKKDWENLHVHIDSYNNFPTAAGLASSAAGFACFGKELFFSSSGLIACICLLHSNDSHYKIYDKLICTIALIHNH